MTNLFFFFFFNDTATTEIYTLSLHDALPIWVCYILDEPTIGLHPRDNQMLLHTLRRLEQVGNSVLVVERSEEHTSELHHSQISYAVFCLKKKKKYHSVLNITTDDSSDIDHTA